MAMPPVTVGQIWLERDPRRERHVQVLEVREKTVAIRSVIRADDGNWTAVKGSRVTEAFRGRFNGGRGGYVIVAEGAR
jgi:hypothetical protein